MSLAEAKVDVAHYLDDKSPEFHFTHILNSGECLGVHAVANVDLLDDRYAVMSTIVSKIPINQRIRQNER